MSITYNNYLKKMNRFLSPSYDKIVKKIQKYFI